MPVSPLLSGQSRRYTYVRYYIVGDLFGYGEDADEEDHVELVLVLAGSV